MGGGWSTPSSSWGRPLGQRSVSYGPPGRGLEPNSAEAGSPPDPIAPAIHPDTPDNHPVGRTPAGPDVPVLPSLGSGRRRHCWVRAGGGDDGDVPGLVLDWRRGPDSMWWGFTQYVVEGAEGPRAILEWLPAQRLRPR